MITSPVCWFLLFIYVFSSVAILNVKPVLCLCVSPLSSSVLLSDKKCENWKAKNNIKKARLAPWWKAVMTMDEWERRERVCVCVCVCVCVGGNKKERGQMDSDRTALSSTFTACVSGIEPITGGTGAEDLGRKQLCSFHKKKKKKKKGRTQRFDVEISAAPTQQAFITVGSEQTQAVNWVWARVSLQYPLEEAASWLYSCCCRDLN